MRVRGLPLDMPDRKVSLIFENFGTVVSGPHHVTWRGTTIKTGDRTLKIKLQRNIPQSFMTLEGKTKITTRYRDQPKTCFECGSLDHERKDCPVNERGTYAQAVAVAQKPTEDTFNIDAVPPEVTPDVTQTSSESDAVDKLQKKEKKENIDTHVLKCKIINRRENFKSMPNIYREMLIAWTDLDLIHHMESVQQILHEPVHGNVNIPQNT